MNIVCNFRIYSLSCAQKRKRGLLRDNSLQSQGTLYAILAFSFWGLTPIYFKMLGGVSATEILAHRIIWSVVFLGLLILFLHRKQEVLSIVKNRRTMILLFFSALIISLNWLTFIWAITHSKIAEASLGYFINPLVNVALGKIFFDEKLFKYQKWAIFIAFLSILYQLLSLGSIPTVSLILAFSFGFYGLLRKKAGVPSIPALFIETLLVLPLALLYFAFLLSNNASAFAFPFDSNSFLLILAGLITITPLIWFNTAARYISMAKLGFFQYIAPSIAFFLAIFIYNEPFNNDKLISFILIWIALGLFSIPQKKVI